MRHETCIQCESRKAKISGFLCHVCERENKAQQLADVDAATSVYDVPKYAFNLSNRGAQIVLREVR